MKFIDQDKQLIAWYKQKLSLSDYGLLWRVLLKRVSVALILERFLLP
tara:strand:- start:280 stop:420 length:141 start_codon:yes stop_codon:yes gene_type:complete